MTGPPDSIVPVDVYASLRQAILEGRLLPNQRLVEPDLMDGLGAARSAVRSALIRLEQEGLVTRERYRGARVRALSNDEAVELLEVRKVVGQLAIRRTAERADKAAITMLAELLDRWSQASAMGDHSRAWELNLELHQKLIALSGHETATWLTAALMRRLFAIGSSIRRGPDVREQSLKEHRRIVRAIRARDPDAAETALTAHLDRIIAHVRAFESSHHSSSRPDGVAPAAVSGSP